MDVSIFLLLSEYLLFSLHQMCHDENGHVIQHRVPPDLAQLDFPRQYLCSVLDFKAHVLQESLG